MAQIGGQDESFAVEMGLDLRSAPRALPSCCTGKLPLPVRGLTGAALLGSVGDDLDRQLLLQSTGSKPRYES